MEGHVPFQAVIEAIILQLCDEHADQDPLGPTYEAAGGRQGPMRQAEDAVRAQKLVEAYAETVKLPRQLKVARSRTKAKTKKLVEGNEEEASLFGD